MWKPIRKEDEHPVPPAPPSPAAQFTPPVAPPKPAVKQEVAHVMDPVKVDNYRPDVAHIGKSVLVKGELSGSEDLYLDGEVEGSIELRGHSLTIGPNGRIRANVHARDVVVHGKVEGNLRATERVELKKSAILIGDIFTQRIAIEDGAFFKGGIDIQKPEAKPESKPAVAPATTANPVATGASATAAPAPQSSFAETKKY